MAKQDEKKKRRNEANRIESNVNGSAKLCQINDEKKKLTETKSKPIRRAWTRTPKATTKNVR